MARMKRLIHEVHRRSLWQVLGVYLAASWVALQVVETLADTVGLPDWFPPVALGLLVIGLPIVLATAFVQEGMGSDGSRAPTYDPVEDASAPAGPSAERASLVPLSGGDYAAPDTEAASHSRHLTWRNAVLGGVCAFALLGLATFAYMGMRTLGIGPAGTLVAKGMIEEGERAVLADFDNATPDSLLGEVVTEAFRVDLAQSPVVSLAEPSYVAEVLARMERPSDSRLDLDLAREVAIREGVRAVITGEVGTAGGAYVLSARVLVPDTGEELASLRETARDSSEIVSAIDDLSKKLRERLGESLRSLRANEPLDRVTTGSLEALRKYSQGMSAIWRGDGARGNALIEEAIEIDSTFAMAWRRLATRTSGERQIEAATRAFELRDRLTDRERYHTIGLYHFYVDHDFERAVTAYRTLLEAHPDDGLALNNLSVSYLWLGDLERALDAATRARDVGYAGTDPYMRSIRWNYRLGRYDEGRAALARLGADRPTHPVAAREEWAVALLDGDLEGARAAATRLGDHELTGWSNAGLVYLALTELGRGRIAAGLEYLASRRGPSDFDRAFGDAWNLDLYVRDDTIGARRRIDAALARTNADELSLLERWNLVRLQARLGRPAAARSLLREIDAGLDSLEQYFPWIPRTRIALAEILTAEARYAEAIEELRESERDAAICSINYCNTDEKARVWDRAGVRDSAIAYYERYVASENYGRAFNIGHVPPVYRRLAELYDEGGDLDNAVKYYAMFVEMWADADEELQPVVRAAQARLEQILAERG